eukprot:5638942-Alexandrium_andersonii.AAC.1
MSLLPGCRCRKAWRGNMIAGPLGRPTVAFCLPPQGHCFPGSMRLHRPFGRGGCIVRGRRFLPRGGSIVPRAGANAFPVGAAR